MGQGGMERGSDTKAKGTAAAQAGGCVMAVALAQAPGSALPHPPPPQEEGVVGPVFQTSKPRFWEKMVVGRGRDAEGRADRAGVPWWSGTGRACPRTMGTRKSARVPGVRQNPAVGPLRAVWLLGTKDEDALQFLVEGRDRAQSQLGPLLSPPCGQTSGPPRCVLLGFLGHIGLRDREGAQCQTRGPPAPVSARRE